MSGEPELRDLVAELLVSLTHAHRRLDDITSRQLELFERIDQLCGQVEAVRDDVRLIKREILPAQSLRLEEFPELHIELAEQTAGDL